MFIFSKKNCLTFLFAVLVTVLLMILIPFNAVKVSAVQGNGMYEIYVIDKKTNKPIEGAFVEIDSDDDAYRNDFPNNGRKRTDSKGAVVYNLEQYFDSRNWINIRFKIAVTAPGTGYENYEGYIWPNASSDQWQGDYTIQLTPSDFADSDYLEKYIDCIDIAYDSKPHYAHEFLDIKDKNAEITYENGKEPSFTEVGNYNIEYYIKSKGFFDYDNNSEELYASIPVRLVKNTRTDFGFLIPEPADIAVPGNKKFSNPASSNLDPQPIVYSSSNPEIAVVDESTGDVDFKKAGTVTVTATMPATANYAESKASYTISGKYSMSVSFTNSTMSGKYGAALPKNSLNVKGTPEPPASVIVSYELEGEDADEIASINSTTGIVTAKKPGTVTVKATITAKDYFSTEAKYTLNIGKGDRKVVLGTNLEYGKTYPIFAEDSNYGDWSYVIMEGKQYISVNKAAGEVTVIAAGGKFRIDIQSPENEYYVGLNAPLMGYAIKCPDQPVEFANDNGYQFTADSNITSFNLALNGKAHYGDFSASWDGKGTEKDVIDSVVFSKDNNDNEFVVVTFKPGEAQKAQGPLNIYATFDGGGNYEAKTIQTKITLGLDTSISTEVVIECPTGKLVNGYYTAPVKVHPKTSGVKIQDPDGNIVSEYWLKKDGVYDGRSSNFYNTDKDGNPTTINEGTVSRILIDQTAPTDFSVDITNQDTSNPLKKYFDGVYTFYAVKEWDITVTVKDSASGFDRIEYDCGDGVRKTVTKFTTTESVSGSTALVTGKITVPAGNKGKLKVWAYDRAGNCISTHDDAGNLVPGFFKYEGQTINTDVYVVVDNMGPEGEKHAPDIDILLPNANAAGFFTGNVSVKLTAEDPAFVGDERVPYGYYSGLKEIKYTIYTTDTNAKKQGTLLDVSKGIGISDALFDKNNVAYSWTGTIVIDADKFNSNNVIVQIEAVDNAGNTRIARTNTGDIKIDSVKPRINVNYDNNEAANAIYFKNTRIATISIVDRNFSADKVNVSIKATDDGASMDAPAVSKWTSNGDTHTATIHFNKDGKYVLRISAKDNAGNAAANTVEQTFYIDTTAPELSITGVKDNSANNGDLAPQILYSDKNYSPDLVTITFSGANRGKLTPDGTGAPVPNGNKFVFNNFAKTKDNDDVYTLYVKVVDLAGNESTKRITFSVNRFGSTYDLSDDAKAINGKYMKDPVDIVISEVNPNELTESKITLYKNDTPVVLKSGVDYDVKKTGGNGAWTEYTYVIHSDNFKDDGVYSVSVYSVDEAGNVSENTLDTKGAALRFSVDNSVPDIAFSNLKDNEIYATDKLTAKVRITDNLLLDSVDVYLDDYDTPYKSWTKEELASVVSGTGEFEFDISGASSGSHKVKIVATDAAGNKHEVEVSDFYVTTNPFVRYYKNTPLVVGSIIALLVIVPVVIVAVVMKRKRFGRG
jgi:hypothetical protein